MFTLLDLGIQKYCVRYIKCQSWVTWKSRKLRVVMKQTFLLDREYLLELRQRKYKQGLAFQGEHRAAVCICREKRKPKAHLELTKVVSNNKKKGFKHVNSQKRSKENIGLIFSDGHLTSKDAEMAFNAIFTFFFFTIMIDLGLPSLLLEDHNWGNGDFSFVVTKIVSNPLNIHKSMGPDGIHPKVLKLDDIIAGPPQQFIKGHRSLQRCLLD